LFPDLTIIGSGPEEKNLRQLAAELALDRQVTFGWTKIGTALAERLESTSHYGCAVAMAGTVWRCPRWRESRALCGNRSEKGGLKKQLAPAV